MLRQVLASAVLLSLGLGTSHGHVLDAVPLIDGHNDLPYNLYHLLENNLTRFDFERNLTSDPIWGVQNCRTCQTDLPRLRQGKVGAQFWVAYVSCDVQYKDALAKTIEQIDVIKRLVKRYPEDLQLVVDADGILDAFGNGKIGSLIAVEGGHSMDSRLGVLRMFYDLGVRYMTLTHACNTPWADNSYVDDSVPVHNLTDFGLVVVREMNRLGMLVDLSHVSHAVMNQAISASRAPVIFSHSSVFALARHSRNVRDDTLRLLHERGGIIMINFYTVFLSSNPSSASVDDAINHINYVVDLIGHDNVGIGGDYDGIESVPVGLEDVSKYPELFDLLRSGNSTRWTDENLGKLAGQNFLRVFREAERVRDSLIDEEPNQHWIPFEDLQAVDDSNLWNCRTLLNNSSPAMVS